MDDSQGMVAQRMRYRQLIRQEKDRKLKVKHDMLMEKLSASEQKRKAFNAGQMEEMTRRKKATKEHQLQHQHQLEHNHEAFIAEIKHKEVLQQEKQARVQHKIATQRAEILAKASRKMAVRLARTERVVKKREQLKQTKLAIREGARTFTTARQTLRYALEQQVPEPELSRSPSEVLLNPFSEAHTTNDVGNGGRQEDWSPALSPGGDRQSEQLERGSKSTKSVRKGTLLRVASAPAFQRRQMTTLNFFQQHLTTRQRSRANAGQPTVATSKRHLRVQDLAHLRNPRARATSAAIVPGQAALVCSPLRQSASSSFSSSTSSSADAAAAAVSIISINGPNQIPTPALAKPSSLRADIAPLSPVQGEGDGEDWASSFAQAFNGDLRGSGGLIRTIRNSPSKRPATTGVHRTRHARSPTLGPSGLDFEQLKKSGHQVIRFQLPSGSSGRSSDEGDVLWHKTLGRARSRRAKLSDHKTESQRLSLPQSKMTDLSPLTYLAAEPAQFRSPASGVYQMLIENPKASRSLHSTGYWGFNSDNGQP